MSGRSQQAFGSCAAVDCLYYSLCFWFARRPFVLRDDRFQDASWQANWTGPLQDLAMRNDDCDNLFDVASMRQAFAAADLRRTDYLLADCLTECQAHSVVSLGKERPIVIAASCWRYQEHCSYDEVLLQRQFPL